jgi:hypothetical protein
MCGKVQTKWWLGKDWGPSRCLYLEGNLPAIMEDTAEPKGQIEMEIGGAPKEAVLGDKDSVLKQTLVQFLGAPSMCLYNPFL